MSRQLAAVLVVLAANYVSALKLFLPQTNQTKHVANQGNTTFMFVCKAPAGKSTEQWYEEEKARIAKDCDGMRDALDKEYQHRLDGGVANAEWKADAAKKAAADAQHDVDVEKGHLDREKGHEAQAKKNCNHTNSDIDASVHKIADYKNNIKDLESTIGEKRKCIEELRQAELDLAKTERDLCEAKSKEQETASELRLKKAGVEKEESHVAKEEEHIKEAEGFLKKAHADSAGAELRLQKARTTRDAARKKSEDEGLSSKDGGVLVIKKEGGVAGWGANVAHVTAIKL